MISREAIRHRREVNRFPLCGERVSEKTRLREEMDDVYNRDHAKFYTTYFDGPVDARVYRVGTALVAQLHVVGRNVELVAVHVCLYGQWKSDRAFHGQPVQRSD